MPLLTRREDDVVRLVADGLKNREIAAKLNVAEHSIRNYLYRIFEKVGVSTRVELILYAFSQRDRIS
jgi:DNA-binding NarL/FixJ family response regulator